MLGLVVSAHAQEGPPLRWTPMVEIRPRYAWDYADGAATLRSRLGLGVERGNLSARVVLQDLRGWDAQGPVAIEGGGLSLHEGWARLGSPEVETVGYAISAGRMPMVVDGGRVLGIDDFTLAARTLDAVRVELFANPFALEYSNARQLETDAQVFSPGINLFRFRGGHDNDTVSWASDALLLLDLREEARLTTGAYGKLSAGRLRTRAEAYVQTEGAAPGLLASASLGWVFGSNEKLTLHARGDFASGAGGGFSAWQNDLGDTHPCFGLAGRVDAGDAEGAADAQLVVEARPAAPLWLSLTGHGFLATVDGAHRGWELDAEGRWWPSPMGSLGVGLGGTTGAIGTGLVAYVEMDVRF